MKLENMTSRHIDIVNSLRQLPKKMICLHGRDNIIEFVLHELCNKRCFNIEKAAFFIDNPDFNCMQGVAGFCQHEAHESEDIWNNPLLFSEHMSQANFNKKVRSFGCESHKKQGHEEKHLTERIAKELEFKNYDFYVVDMKHDNHGFFMYEPGDEHDDTIKDIIRDSLYLLGFCSIP